MSRLTSPQVRLLLLVPLSNNQVWHIDELRKWIESGVKLSDEDRRPYPDRPNEEVWYASIDNALSPARTTSLVAIGEVRQISKGLYQITDRGLEEAEKVKSYLAACNDGSKLSK